MASNVDNPLVNEFRAEFDRLVAEIERDFPQLRRLLDAAATEQDVADVQARASRIFRRRAARLLARYLVRIQPAGSA